MLSFASVTSFFQSVPNELEEASKIDGCNYFRHFLYYDEAV